MDKPNVFYTGTVSIWNLPRKLVYVGLLPEYKTELLTTIKTLSTRKNWKSLAEMLNEKLDALTPFVLRDAKVSLNLLEKFSDLLVKNGFHKFDKKEIEKYIIRIGAQKNSKEIIRPNTPFNFVNRSGMIFISAIMHDGGITKSGQQPFYVNTKISLKECVKEAAQNIFGSMDTASINIENKQIVFPKIVGIILIYGIGLESGDKTIKDTLIPEFIKKTNINLKSVYVQQAFDDEGSVSVKNKTISFKSAVLYEKRPMLTEIVQSMLNDMKIKAKISRDYDYISKSRRKTCWVLHIHGEDNLEKFFTHVSFKIKEKEEKLRIILDSYKQHHDCLWQQTIIKKLRGMQNKDKFTRKDIQSLISKSERRTSNYITWLLERGIIVKIESRKNIGRGFAPCVYRISKDV